jgi:hypothetical protein
MRYFSNFPSISYSLDDNDLEYKLIKNPLTRVRFIREVLQNVKVFYEYDISDSDSPEIIAHKLYEDANRYWIVMFANDLIDPYYDVPLKDADLESYVKYKYGIPSSDSTIISADDEYISADNDGDDVGAFQIHHYERKTKVVTNKDGNIDEHEYVIELQQYSYDFSSNSIVTNTLPTLENPIIVVSSETTEVANDGVIITKTITDHVVTNYDYELRENEKKRKIRLVRPEYVADIETQFKTLLNR